MRFLNRAMQVDFIREAASRAGLRQMLSQTAAGCERLPALNIDNWFYPTLEETHENKDAK